jgi:D-alanine transfer protein
MKLKNFVLNHVLPIVLVFLIAYLTMFAFDNSLKTRNMVSKEITGKQTMQRGCLSNFSSGEQSEIELNASLRNRKYITLFGSSEFNASVYCPFHFLPDSLNQPVVGFGHAYMQSLSILCELMANQKDIKGSKVCIILSPGWFTPTGTNIEAFIEFVRPNFLNTIIHNKNIPDFYKLELGKYINSHIDDIENPSNDLIYLKNLRWSKNLKTLESINSKLYLKTDRINYASKLMEISTPEYRNFDWAKTRQRLQASFRDSTKTNSFFIKDSYYKSFLLDENKKYFKEVTGAIECNSNREFIEFKLLVKFLKENKCDATFVLQPLNPFHYEKLENFNETFDSVTSILKQNKFEFLNLFTTKVNKYEAGTLNDVMHFGDFGWMKVNEFMYNHYNKLK